MVLRMRLQLQNAIGERKAFEYFKEATLTHLPYVLEAYISGNTVPTAVQNVSLCSRVNYR